ncbi:hypothetical protein FKP32DRAFT_580946 [Trametes sanguinea]|nr:hypothetical protein FKP32DRAFT_580946 [Trametes sanguinea]
MPCLAPRSLPWPPYPTARPSVDTARAVFSRRLPPDVRPRAPGYTLYCSLHVLAPLYVLLAWKSL